MYLQLISANTAEREKERERVKKRGRNINKYIINKPRYKITSTIKLFFINKKALLHNEVLHLCLFLMNPKHYQNETWSNTRVRYGKHLYF